MNKSYSINNYLLFTNIWEYNSVKLTVTCVLNFEVFGKVKAVKEYKLAFSPEEPEKPEFFYRKDGKFIHGKSVQSVQNWAKICKMCYKCWAL